MYLRTDTRNSVLWSDQPRGQRISYFSPINVSGRVSRVTPTLLGYVSSEPSCHRPVVVYPRLSESLPSSRSPVRVVVETPTTQAVTTLPTVNVGATHLRREVVRFVSSSGVLTLRLRGLRGVGRHKPPYPYRPLTIGSTTSGSLEDRPETFTDHVDH